MLLSNKIKIARKHDETKQGWFGLRMSTRECPKTFSFPCQRKKVRKKKSRLLFACHKWQEILNCKFVTFTGKSEAKPTQPLNAMLVNDHVNKKEVSQTEVWKQMYLHMMWCTCDAKITYDVVWLVVFLPSFKQNQNSFSTNLLEQW